MMSQPLPNPSFMDLSDDEFISKLKACSKFKQRAHQTYHAMHLPELNARLNLHFDLPPPPHPAADDSPDPRGPDFSNTSNIETVYLGNSMLERLKTTGIATRIGSLGKDGRAWNAGCGGDKNEHVVYRLSEGMYSVLKNAQELRNPKCDIKGWVLASGTNNLRTKRPFRAAEVECYRLLLRACLRIAPRSRVVACDMFYRKDVPDAVVDTSNGMLKAVVEEVNKEISSIEGMRRVMWVEARGVLDKDMLVDHVHLTEEGYMKWDEALESYVEGERPYVGAERDQEEHEEVKLEKNGSEVQNQVLFCHE